MQKAHAIFNRLLQPHPDELRQSVWFQEEARAERLTGLIRIGYLTVWLGNTAPAISVHPSSWNIANVGVGSLWFVWACVYYWYLLKRPYQSPFKYFSLTIDVIITSTILFLYQYDGGYSITLKAPSWVNLLMVLMLAAFRFKIWLPIYGGLLSIATYGILIMYFHLNGSLELGSPQDHFTGPRVNAYYVYFHVAYIATAAFLSAVLVYNIRHMVAQQIKQIEATNREKAEREKTLHVLERYFTPSIAKHLLEHPSELGGRSRNITVMISDVRNFTKLSEQLGPARTVAILNNLLEHLVPIVFKYNGTLDKFLGDGMLVIFGFPESNENASWQAVQAAREMVETVSRIGQEMGLKLGIAIHEGDAIMGNIGSSQRMEFTVIGDVVNTASRMEALNKEFSSNIIISNAVRIALQDRLPIRELPVKNLRGKIEELPLFEVFCNIDGCTMENRQS